MLNTVSLPEKVLCFSYKIFLSDNIINKGAGFFFNFLIVKDFLSALCDSIPNQPVIWRI